jgi:hypothetical protein
MKRSLGLRLLEFVIPGVLENCSDGAPFPHDPAVDTETGLVYYTDSSRHCIGQFNPETLEFRAWPTATAGAEPHGLVSIRRARASLPSCPSAPPGRAHCATWQRIPNTSASGSRSAA